MLFTRQNTGYCIFCTYRTFSPRSLRTQSGWRRLNDENRHPAPNYAYNYSTSAHSLREPIRARFSKRRDSVPPRVAKETRLEKPYLSKQSLNVRGRSRNATVDLIKLTISRLDYLSRGKVESPLLQSLQQNGSSHENSFAKFKAHTISALRNSENYKSATPSSGRGQSLYKKLQSVFSKDGLRGLDAHLKYEFYGYMTRLKFSKTELENHVELVDLRYPSEWYPKARTTQREIHLHVGPTNSGKTYHALKRLEQAEVGVYAGPLRLLAQEVYSRMNNSGKRCILLTGEERRSPDEELKAALISCTVEMMPVSSLLDVAVIDEIQMIGNPDRGWAWTQAFLGVNAKEVHLCGEERAVPLIKELTAFVGDRLHIHKYKRLSPLEVMWQSLDGNLKQLRKGDCIVSFSIMGIHSMKKAVEKMTGRKVAIVYGSLPPETRAQQARLFNDPNNDYDFLVASDAIGMGLNLSIKRIVFESVLKYDGQGDRMLTISETKQIAGRAGRYRTADQATDSASTNVAKNSRDSSNTNSDELLDTKTDKATEPLPSTTGLVTTMEREHLPFVKKAMNMAAEPIKTAGVLPPDTIVQRFSTYFPPNTPFSYILLRLHDIAQRSSRFHLCALRDQLLVADAIHPVQKLSVRERIIFCAAPTGNNPLLLKLIKVFASYAADQKQCSIVDVPELPLEVLDCEKPKDREHLRQLEDLHKGINLYLWLSYRLHGIFNSRMLAFYAKKLVEAAIERSLAAYDFVRRRRKVKKIQDENKMYEMLQTKLLQSENEDGEGTDIDGEAGLRSDDNTADSTLSNENESGSGLYETDDPIMDVEEIETGDNPSSLSFNDETPKEAFDDGVAVAVETDLKSDTNTHTDTGSESMHASRSTSTPASNYEADAELDFHDEFKGASPQWAKEPTVSSGLAQNSDDCSNSEEGDNVDNGAADHQEVHLRDKSKSNEGHLYAGKSKAGQLEQRNTTKASNAAHGPLSTSAAQVANVDALVSVPQNNKSESRVDRAG